MKAILGALILVPLMQAVALAQAPTADAKEGKIYVDGGIGIGVATMAGPSTAKKGFDSIAQFGAGFAGEYGITETLAVFTKMGLGVGLDDDPGLLTFGMTVDGAYKLIEKKGDVPALAVFAGMGFLHIDVDPKGAKSDDATDFVAEFGVQGDFGATDALSVQPFFQVQVVAGPRPFKAYNGMLQLVAGVKVLYKLSDNLFLEPSVVFTGGNFSDSVMFGIGVQLRL